MGMIESGVDFGLGGPSGEGHGAGTELKPHIPSRTLMMRQGNMSLNPKERVQCDRWKKKDKGRTRPTLFHCLAA